MLISKLPTYELRAHWLLSCLRHPRGHPPATILSPTHNNLTTYGTSLTLPQVSTSLSTYLLMELVTRKGSTHIQSRIIIVEPLLDTDRTHTRPTLGTEPMPDPLPREHVLLQLVAPRFPGHLGVEPVDEQVSVAKADCT